jgi:hypothetical protein
MLSPHEFATLMLIKNDPDQLDVDREEIQFLVNRHLVELAQPAPGVRRPCLTRAGDSVLRAVARMR